MNNTDNLQTLTVGIAQIAPVWLKKKETLTKVAHYMDEAGAAGCELLIFGEALLPGYPFWLAHTDGAAFESPLQKAWYAHYLQQAVDLQKGELDGLCAICRKYNMASYLGIIERAADRGGHSLYCALVYIDEGGNIQSVHRKLQPTYEERLCWAPGDGHGLRTHPLKAFQLGGLNCWENWMPLARTALYAQGENVHVATWPGALRNTTDITRFIAKEARSYVISVSGLLKKEDIPTDLPHYEQLIAKMPDVLADGGSCVADPTGEWLLPPVIGEEKLLFAELSFQQIAEERQNFDPVGHYARPDVLQLQLNAERQSSLKVKH